MATLHPKMHARAQATKAAHQRLSKDPAFRTLPTKEQFRRTATEATKATRKT